jgi:hypothetical protein
MCHRPIVAVSTGLSARSAFSEQAELSLGSRRDRDGKSNRSHVKTLVTSVRVLPFGSRQKAFLFRDKMTTGGSYVALH